MATYGEGDPTDNAQEFHEYLQRGDGDFSGLSYAVSIIGACERKDIVSSAGVWAGQQNLRTF